MLFWSCVDDGINDYLHASAGAAGNFTSAVLSIVSQKPEKPGPASETNSRVVQWGHSSSVKATVPPSPVKPIGTGADGMQGDASDTEVHR
jgi:hypothetical protein